MHWPEYNPRKKQNSSGRSPAVLPTLAISVLMAGELNGWWQLTPLPGNRQAEIAASTVMATPASGVVVIVTSVPPAPTRTPLPMALTFPSVRDDSGETSGTLYRFMGLPTSVFITLEGKVAHVQVGQLTDGQIDAYSQRLIIGEEIVP